MTIETIDVATPDGPMPTVIARPESGKPKAFVLIYMDAMGIRDELVTGFAKRYADAGFIGVLPDLYYRFGKGISFDATKSYKELPAEQQPLFFSLVEKMRADQPVTRDTGLLLDAVPASEAERHLPWGTIGYCMGGRFVVRAMEAYPERLKVGVSVYGTALVTDKPDSPHLRVGDIRGDIRFAFGGDDELTPPSMIDTLRESLEEAGVTHSIETFAGAGHAFMMPGKPSSYRHDAAEAVWERSLAAFARL